MLSTVDRVQVVVADRAAVAAAWKQLLDVVVVSEDRVDVLAARRTTIQFGHSETELLEPDGAGPTADFLRRTGGGLFAAGLATPNVDRVRATLESQGVPVAEEGGQLFLTADGLGIPGLRVVVSPVASRPPAGLVSHLYEVTLLATDFVREVERTCHRFGLAPAAFAPIQSEEFGYEGTLALFDPDRLDRLEIITPSDPTKTMGRFFARRGPCLYMCFAEADDLAPIRARLREHAPHGWTGSDDVPHPDNLFIHPATLGGVMLGISRTSVAWVWSGHPERVRPVEP